MSKNVHLVCSAGGVKCFSYIGAIRKLNAVGINIASISACSMGTIMGALFASGLDLNEIEQKIINFNFKHLKTKKVLGNLRVFLPPFATHYIPKYDQIFVDLIGEDIPLKKLVIPFSALALDIRQNRFLVYSTESHPEMKISELVKIATSVPFMYPPHKIDKRILVDAAVAAESPVWMAVNQSGNYPIVVLKINKEVNDFAKTNFASYLANLFSVSAESHDYFAASQVSRLIEICINSEDIQNTDFNISKAQIENLILQGEKAAELQLQEYNDDFNNIFALKKHHSIEELKLPSVDGNNSVMTVNAVNLAKGMLSGFNNEIMNRQHVFVSYSHLDKNWLEKFNHALSAMERFAGIKAWSDKLILAGNDWNYEITKALQSAKVAVFLVTPNFLSSKFIQENEMNYFLELNKTQKVPIIWVAISHSLYEITPLSEIQCANIPSIPLDTMSEAEQNLHITEISKKIIQLMNHQATSM